LWSGARSCGSRGLSALQVVRTPGSARAIARTLRRPVGFVPTMGALHAGHLSLVERAARENASVVASIFVNPMQFGPGEDFERYPRDFARDADLLERGGVDLLYAPSPERVYPSGFSTAVDVGQLGTVLEGQRRPGHFVGVTTIVAKLLHAVEPTSLYLGQKDVQQAVVLRAMVRDLDMATNVVVAPTVREPDGLALSSRNVYLSPEQRAAAPSLYRALQEVAATLLAGETDPAHLRAAGRALLDPPLMWDYLEIVDPRTFLPQSTVVRPALIVGVAKAGLTRLLDNVPVAGADGLDPILTPLSPRIRSLR
jgi:pantoate--beta-alanine ligase